MKVWILAEETADGSCGKLVSAHTSRAAAKRAQGERAAADAAEVERLLELVCGSSCSYLSPARRLDELMHWAGPRMRIPSPFGYRIEGPVKVDP